MCRKARHMYTLHNQDNNVPSRLSSRPPCTAHVQVGPGAPRSQAFMRRAHRVPKVGSRLNQSQKELGYMVVDETEGQIVPGGYSQGNQDQTSCQCRLVWDCRILAHSPVFYHQTNTHTYIRQCSLVFCTVLYRRFSCPRYQAAPLRCTCSGAHRGM
jgi:hypothetical protein